MQEKQIDKETKKAIFSIAGQEGVDIFENLPDKTYINEFTLADKVNMHINFVRSILYMFYNKNMVEYERKREVCADLLGGDCTALI